MMHNSLGPFDVDLPTSGNPGIECRSAGANDGYTLVFKFATNLQNVDGASVTSGSGSVLSSNIDSSDTRNYIVNLTGVTNAQVIVVSLTNVTDTSGNFSNTVSGQMAVLIGDTTGNGVVNSSDISQTQSQSGQDLTSSNFREDVTVNGVINSSDISLVQSKSGTALP
jgi:phage baseplate assembly protein gpV